MLNILLINMLLVMLVFFLFSLIFYKSLLEMDSLSSYECGFNPSSATRLKFSYRFFLIAILFIIFDVEIALLLPIPFVMSSLFMLWLFFIFLLILVGGLLYEYMWGSLDWLN